MKNDHNGNLHGHHTSVDYMLEVYMAVQAVAECLLNHQGCSACAVAGLSKPAGNKDFTQSQQAYHRMLRCKQLLHSCQAPQESCLAWG